MKQFKLDINKLSKQDIKLIADYFKHGKVVVYPTDTIYGLGCLASNSRAIARIRKIKQRGQDRPLLILVNSLAMLKKYCYLGQKQSMLLRSVWPGAVTVVLKSRGVLPAELSGGRETMAVRLPNNKFLCTIIRETREPIVSTSLNLSGRKPIINPDKLDKYFKNNKPDLLIKAGRVGVGRASTIVDIRDINHIKILRN